MAELILIPGKPSEPAPDEFECEPTFLGQLAWELDQAIDRRKAFRIVSETEERSNPMEALIDDLVGKLTGLRNLIVVRNLVADLNSIRLPGPAEPQSDNSGFSAAQLLQQRALDDAIFRKRAVLADLRLRTRKAEAALAKVSARVAEASADHVQIETHIANFKKELIAIEGGSP